MRSGVRTGRLDFFTLYGGAADLLVGIPIYGPLKWWRALSRTSLTVAATIFAAIPLAFIGFPLANSLTLFVLFLMPHHAPILQRGWAVFRPDACRGERMDRRQAGDTPHFGFGAFPVTDTPPEPTDRLHVGLSSFAEPPEAPLPTRRSLGPFVRGLLIAPAFAAMPLLLVLEPLSMLQGWFIFGVLAIGIVGAIVALAIGIPAFLILRKTHRLSRRSLTITGAVAAVVLPALFVAALGMRELWLQPSAWELAKVCGALLWMGGATFYIAADIADIPPRRQREATAEIA